MAVNDESFTLTVSPQLWETIRVRSLDPVRLERSVPGTSKTKKVIRNMKSMSCSLFVALLSAAISNASAALQNGGFESPVLTGGYATNFSVAPPGFAWTVVSNNIEVLRNDYWQPSSGLQSIDLNGATPSSIYQDFTFSSSGTWRLLFDLSANPDAITQGDGLGTGVKNMRVDFGVPGSLSSLGIFGVASDPRTVANMVWTSQIGGLVAVSDSVTYRLQFTSLVPGNGGAVLDNIRFELVPEPGMLTLVGVGLFGFLFRRSLVLRR